MSGMIIKSILITMVILTSWGCEGQREANQMTAEDSLNVESAQMDSPDMAVFREVSEPQVEVDLPKIRKRGRLIALTGYSSNSYFIYKGETMGFEYELLTLLARHLKLDLEVIIVRDLDQIFSLLNQGKGDLVAYGMTITKQRLKKIDFTDHHSLIHQVLVQRLPDNWRQMKRHEIDRLLITNPVELIGKKVYVRKGSSYYARLVNLSEEIGGDIDIVEVPGDVSTEELIVQVANGDIDYTVADENYALVNAAYHQNIDIRTRVSFSQRIAWAVRKNSPELREAVNQWIKIVKQEPTYNVLYEKYYLNKRFYQQRVESEFFSLTGEKISPYDEMIKARAAELKWDWRLLASQVYQESQFDPRAKSWAGARGLMQLMPQTARQFGAKNVLDPLQNLTAATNYMKWLEEYWREIPDSNERVKFVLASYNTGQGHVEDARRLAEEYSHDANRWDDDVAQFLLKKSQEKYFNDPVVQYGYCRGEEPVNYVREILERYHDYRKFSKN